MWHNVQGLIVYMYTKVETVRFNSQLGPCEFFFLFLQLHSLHYTSYTIQVKVIILYATPTIYR